jgi:hypothetical protein
VEKILKEMIKNYFFHLLRNAKAIRALLVDLLVSHRVVLFESQGALFSGDSLLSSRMYVKAITTIARDITAILKEAHFLKLLMNRLSIDRDIEFSISSTEFFSTPFILVLPFMTSWDTLEELLLKPVDDTAVVPIDDSATEAAPAFNAGTVMFNFE